MAKPTDIPIDTLRQLVRLDPETGRLYWIERGPEWFTDGAHTAAHSCAKWNAAHAGKPALGSVNGSGYRHGSLLGRTVTAARAVFALANGRWPRPEVDHRDGDKTNDRPGNLREATRVQQCRNMGSARNSTSRFRGVSADRRSGRWQVQCTSAEGRRTTLGTFQDDQVDHPKE